MQMIFRIVKEIIKRNSFCEEMPAIKIEKESYYADIKTIYVGIGLNVTIYSQAQIEKPSTMLTIM